jgi:dTDP-4-amino-4,6-dideoxygalactose transaminase
MTATIAQPVHEPDIASAEPRIPFADCWIAPNARKAAARVLESGWMTTGPKVHEFETVFAQRVEAPYAVAVSSCTDAIELSLRSLHLAPGAPVLTSTLTFCGAVQAIEHAGLTPVLVDVDPVTAMPTEATTYDAVNACDGPPAARLVVHLGGDPADVEALAAAAGLPMDRVVQDAAHAIGTSRHGEPIGSGTAACFSFYATKNLPIGEGGMITTDDPDRAAWLRQARLHGMSQDAWNRGLPGGSWRYNVHEHGLKANLSDLMAAIGIGQLAHLDEWQRRRAAIAARYDELLGGLPGIGLPHRPDSDEDRHAWHLYAIRILPEAGIARDAVMAAMADAGIGTSVHFIPIHRLDHLAAVSVAPAGGCPGADELAEQLLSLPLYPRLTDAQVDRVAETLGSILKPGRPCGSLV